MLGVRGEIHPAQVRMCLACGRRGPEFQGDVADGPFECPSCHADLYARPPRSYAEMEGIEPTAPDARWARARRADRPDQPPRVPHPLLRIPLGLLIIGVGAAWAAVSLAAVALT